MCCPLYAYSVSESIYSKKCLSIRYRNKLSTHLDGGDALFCPSHLEVHVSEVVLEAGDVSEHLVLTDVLLFWVFARLHARHQAHRHAAHARLQRHACVHQRHARGAHRGHAAAAVGLENLAVGACGEGELVGKNWVDGLFGQGAVADLAPVCSAAYTRYLVDSVAGELVKRHRI